MREEQDSCHDQHHEPCHDPHIELHRWEDDGGRVPVRPNDEDQEPLLFLHRMRQDLMQLDCVED